MADPNLHEFLALLEELALADDEQYAPGFDLPRRLALPFVVPDGLRELFENRTLGDNFTLMGENGNSALDVIEDELKENGVIADDPDYDQTRVFKEAITVTGYDAAETMYNVIMAGNEVYTMPPDLREVLSYLGVPWPPIYTDPNIMTIVTAVAAVLGMAGEVQVVGVEGVLTVGWGIAGGVVGHGDGIGAGAAGAVHH